MPVLLYRHEAAAEFMYIVVHSDCGGYNLDIRLFVFYCVTSRRKSSSRRNWKHRDRHLIFEV